jgi:hypothetical protein
VTPLWPSMGAPTPALTPSLNVYTSPQRTQLETAAEI